MRAAGRASVLGILMFAIGAPSHANEGEPVSDGASQMCWQLPSPKVQMEMDSQLIPLGKGAVFVPAMTDSAAEPPFAVMKDQQVVKRVPTGQKAILAPGKYTVLVGSGVETQMTEHPVEVFEGHCELIDPTWAGLVVRVVDRHGMLFRGAYELFALPGGEDFGLGLGADETRGETLRTWLLPPGRYLIVRSGETSRARTDFVTVLARPGEMINFTLVQDEEGRFLGGGVVDRGEGRTEIENWRLGLIVGGDLSWSRADNVVGREFGNTVTMNAFVDWSMRYLDPHHSLIGRLQIDEGQTVVPGQDFLAWRQKTNDEIDMDVIYTYRLLPWLGPYVRFGLDTNLFPGWKTFDRMDPELEKDVLFLDSDGQQIARKTPPQAGVIWQEQLADSFDPLELKEGIGVSFDLSPWQMLDFHLRLGFGARNYLVRSLFKAQDGVVDDADDPCHEFNCFQRVDSSNLLGLEATMILSARLTRWFMIDTELDTLLPFVGDGGGQNPVINWKNTLSLRLVSFASVAYVFRLDLDRQLTTELQFEQRILLRFTFDIL